MKINKSEIKLVFEYLMPYLIGFIFSIVINIFNIKIIKLANIKEVIDAILSTSSIIVGFLVAMLSLIFTFSKISFLEAIRKYDVNKLYSKYIKVPVFWGFLTIVTSILLLCVIEDSTSDIMWIIFTSQVWAYITMVFLSASMRITVFIFKMVDEFLYGKDEEYEIQLNADKVGDNAIDLKDL